MTTQERQLLNYCCCVGRTRARVIVVGFVLEAGFADENEFVAGFEGAVFVVAGLATAVNAGADINGFVAEFYTHAIVKDIERAFPQAVVTKLLTILYDAAVNLIHLPKTAVFHEAGEDFAADAARAVRDHRLVLDIVILATF